MDFHSLALGLPFVDLLCAVPSLKAIRFYLAQHAVYACYSNTPSHTFNAPLHYRSTYISLIATMSIASSMERMRLISELILLSHVDVCEELGTLTPALSKSEPFISPLPSVQSVLEDGDSYQTQEQTGAHRDAQNPAKPDDYSMELPQDQTPLLVLPQRVSKYPIPLAPVSRENVKVKEYVTTPRMKMSLLRLQLARLEVVQRRRALKQMKSLESMVQEMKQLEGEFE